MSVTEVEVEVEVPVEEVIYAPKPVEYQDTLLDYVTPEDQAIGDHHVVTEQVTEDQLVIVDDPYQKGSLVSLDGEVCEKAIGHDGYYDPETNKWMLEDDYDYEPEWRCLMRPLLIESVKGVAGAELSIENKGILEEKQALVRVHEKLVSEAEEELKKKSCLEYIEKKMSKY